MTRTRDNAHAEGPGRTRFGRTFLALFGLGLLGGLSMIPTVIGQLDALPPELADLPPCWRWPCRWPTPQFSRSSRWLSARYWPIESPALSDCGEGTAGKGDLA